MTNMETVPVGASVTFPMRPNKLQSLPHNKLGTIKDGQTSMDAFSVNSSSKDTSSNNIGNRSNQISEITYEEGDSRSKDLGARADSKGNIIPYSILGSVDEFNAFRGKKKIETSPSRQKLSSRRSTSMFSGLRASLTLARGGKSAPAGSPTQQETSDHSLGVGGAIVSSNSGDEIVQGDETYEAELTSPANLSSAAYLEFVRDSVAKQTKANAAVVAKRDKIYRAKRMKGMLLHEKISYERQEQALKLWNRWQKEWSHFRAGMSKQLKKPADELVVARAEGFREILEEYDVLWKATPQQMRHGSDYWQMSLRGHGTRYVAVGNIFSGLFCPIHEDSEKELEVIRKPRNFVDFGRRDGFANDADGGMSGTGVSSTTSAGGGWRDSNAMQKRRKELGHHLRSCRPHLITADVADGLQVMGQSLFEWATVSTEEHMLRLEELDEDDMKNQAFEDDSDEALLATGADAIENFPSHENAGASGSNNNNTKPSDGPSWILTSEEHSTVVSAPAESTESNTPDTQQQQEFNLFVETSINSSAHVQVTAHNTGSTSLYFHWTLVDAPERVKALLNQRGAEEHPDHKKFSESVFVCHLDRGVLLPGQQLCFTFAFQSPTPGIWSEEWTMITVPPVRAQPCHLVHLRAVATAPDNLVIHRSKLGERLEKNQMNLFVRRLVYDLVNDMQHSVPVRLTPEDQQRALRQSAFELANRAVGYYYVAGAYESVLKLARRVFGILRLNEVHLDSVKGQLGHSDICMQAAVEADVAAFTKFPSVAVVRGYLMRIRQGHALRPFHRAATVISLHDIDERDDDLDSLDSARQVVLHKQQLRSSATGAMAGRIEGTLGRRSTTSTDPSVLSSAVTSSASSAHPLHASQAGTALGSGLLSSPSYTSIAAGISDDKCLPCEWVSDQQSVLNQQADGIEDELVDVIKAVARRPVHESNNWSLFGDLVRRLGDYVVELACQFEQEDENRLAEDERIRIEEEKEAEAVANGDKKQRSARKNVGTTENSNEELENNLTSQTEDGGLQMQDDAMNDDAMNDDAMNDDIERAYAYYKTKQNGFKVRAQLHRNLCTELDALVDRSQQLEVQKRTARLEASRMILSRKSTLATIPALPAKLPAVLNTDSISAKAAVSSSQNKTHATADTPSQSIANDATTGCAVATASASADDDKASGQTEKGKKENQRHPDAPGEQPEATTAAATVQDPVIATLLAHPMAGKRVMIRADLDIPHVAQDVARLDALVSDVKLARLAETIACVASMRPSIIVVVGHRGDWAVPMDKEVRAELHESLSLRVVAEELGEKLGREVIFFDDCIGDEALSSLGEPSMEDGNAVPDFAPTPEEVPIFVLENLRFHNEEFAATTSRFARTFQRKLATMADVLVNDCLVASRLSASSTMLSSDSSGAGKRIPHIAGATAARDMASISCLLESPSAGNIIAIGDRSFLPILSTATTKTIPFASLLSGTYDSNNTEDGGGANQGGLDDEEDFEGDDGGGGDSMPQDEGLGPHWNTTRLSRDCSTGDIQSRVLAGNDALFTPQLDAIQGILDNGLARQILVAGNLALLFKCAMDSMGPDAAKLLLDPQDFTQMQAGQECLPTPVVLDYNEHKPWAPYSKPAHYERALMLLERSRRSGIRMHFPLDLVTVPRGAKKEEQPQPQQKQQQQREQDEQSATDDIDDNNTVVDETKPAKETGYHSMPATLHSIVRMLDADEGMVVLGIGPLTCSRWMQLMQNATTTCLTDSLGAVEYACVREYLQPVYEMITLNNAASLSMSASVTVKRKNAQAIAPIAVQKRSTNVNAIVAERGTFEMVSSILSREQELAAGVARVAEKERRMRIYKRRSEREAELARKAAADAAAAAAAAAALARSDEDGQVGADGAVSDKTPKSTAPAAKKPSKAAAAKEAEEEAAALAKAKEEAARIVEERRLEDLSDATPIIAAPIPKEHLNFVTDPTAMLGVLQNMLVPGFTHVSSQEN